MRGFQFAPPYLGRYKQHELAIGWRSPFEDIEYRFVYFVRSFLFSTPDTVGAELSSTRRPEKRENYLSPASICQLTGIGKKHGPACDR